MKILNPKIVTKISFAMLALFSMALLVLPVPQEVEAQNPRPKNMVNVCFDTENGNVSFPATADCKGIEKLWVYPEAKKGVCVYDQRERLRAYTIIQPGNQYPEATVVDTTGKICTHPEIPGKGVYTKFPSTNTNTNQNNNNTNPNNNNTNPNNNNTNPNNNNGTVKYPTTPNTQSSAGCETNFHKVGPLCVPNSPFASDSIAGGNQTATSIAIRVIRVLLYFAAIVAVIMIIIGGYYVMTAQGNEAQATTGRKTLTNAIIGLGITILAYLIVQAVLNFITK